NYYCASLMSNTIEIRKKVSGSSSTLVSKSWDLYMAQYPITIEQCWTWRNGDPASFSYTGSSWAGNGSGFKVGGGTSHGAHVLKNCIAFDINYGVNSNHKAFDQNGSSGALTGVTFYNCLAFNSMYGFYFAVALTDGTHHTFKNCVQFGNSKGNNLSSDVVQDHNNWNLSLIASPADFKTIDVNMAKAARQADGSLPNNDFCKLASGSILINKGVNVGIPYLGTAPDLGAFECY
ncbi:MAG TPA: hypothetical protein VHY08_28440, partial [Bacillota bacterium]|nr:hypothetical protein [Bacillota bacterium]